ncbi:MAG: energy-coupling factor transporter transmembrane protein EcfT [Oscillospiraceae bacterium]|nr:energy-coupling factor transporter transmembrane protein EcfT [Oscillospiraceae bacterium]
MKRDALSSCHPAVAFSFFAIVLTCTAFWMHPVSLAISLVCAALYAAHLGGVRDTLRYLIPMALLAAVVNPLFSHAGATVLAYLPSGNPLTLESILYGVAAGAMLAAVVLWLRCCTAVLTADKFVWLFGKAVPTVSLLLSMTLRFVPRFRQRYRAVSEARRGMDSSRVRHAFAVLSVTVKWSMETAIETADSMKCRGYGLPGRTSYSIYRLSARDKYLLSFFAVCAAYLAAGRLAGALGWAWYPVLRGSADVWFQLAFAALCLTPMILNGWEERAWRISNSAI